MAHARQKIVLGAAGLLFLVLVAGCATTSRKVTMLYQPVVHDGKGAGTMYLAGVPGSTDRADIQWIVGTMKNSDGATVGDIVSPIAPADLVTDALNQELAAAGYSVSSVEALPSTAAKGIVVTGVDIHMNDVASLIKEEGTSRLKITVELWKNGAKFKKLSYESSFSDFAIKDRDQLLPTTLQKALQGAMDRAVPEIIAAFEH